MVGGNTAGEEMIVCLPLGLSAVLVGKALGSGMSTVLTGRVPFIVPVSGGMIEPPAYRVTKAEEPDEDSPRIGSFAEGAPRKGGRIP